MTMVHDELLVGYLENQVEDVKRVVVIDSVNRHLGIASRRGGNAAENG